MVNTPLQIDGIDALSAKLIGLSQHIPGSQRLVFGIAGAPGSGKSTLAGQLATALEKSVCERFEAVAVVPMDGYHLDNTVLDQYGTRAVKGSPQTFDVSGFLSLLQRIRVYSNDVIYIPVFDREADLARNATQRVGPEHSIVLVEGNYLLLQRPGWCDIKALLDYSLMLDVPQAELEKRLIQRWLDHGHSEQDATARAMGNDIPNAHIVLQESQAADLNYKSVRQ